MSQMTDYLEAALLNHTFRGVAWTAPATVWAAAMLTNPVDAGTGGTEVSAGGYARVAIIGTTTTWTAPGAAGTIGNAALLNFGTATADWGTVTGIAIFNADTSGTCLMFGTLTANKAIASSDIFQIAIGDLGIQFA